MKTAMRAALSLAGVVLLLPAVACSGTDGESPSEGSAASEETVETTNKAQSIAEVFEKIGCQESDPLGTRGKIDAPGDFNYDPPMVKNGTCAPVEGGGLAFFYQYGSPEDAVTASENGSIELGASDQLFQDGAVLILAPDDATANVIVSHAERVG